MNIRCKSARTVKFLSAVACLFIFDGFSLAADELEEGFKCPPQDVRPQVWWHWMYGNITEEGITKDLEQLNKLGISGVTQFHNAMLNKGPRSTPKGPVRFMSQEYQDLVQHAVKECNRLNMTMGLQICDGFSQAGGPWIKPDDGMRKLTVNTLSAQGGETLSVKLPEQTVRVLAYRGSLKALAEPQKNKRAPDAPMINPKDPYLKEENARAPAIKSKEFIDLTDQCTGPNLNWKAPNGSWVVLVFYDALHPKTNHPASPEGTGLEANKLNSEAIDILFDNYVGKLIENAGDLAGKTLRHVLLDSWECGYQSWTEGFAEEFKKRRGYDPTPYLPVLAMVPVNSIEESNRFLTDFRVTLDDLLIEEFYGHLRERLNEKGMELHAEVLYGWNQWNGMFGSPIRQYGVVDVPMNEMWMEKQYFGNRRRNLHGRAYTGYAATAGHVYGKPIIKDESFTVAGTGDFHYLPALIKPAADYQLCRGTSRFVMHTSVHQPTDDAPGWTHSFNGVNVHRGNTWWPCAKGFIDYLARCSYLMQQGVFAADVIRYIGHEDTYSEGYGELPIEGLPLGYRADHCDNTVLLERMDVKDGRIVLPDGISYAVLLLADKKSMAPEVLMKIKELVDKGATVIGPRPEHAPGLTDYPESDAKVKRLAAELWDGGKIRDIPLAQALKEKGLQPDFSYNAPPRKSAINFVHRKLPDADIYFIATAGEGAEMDCSFRISGKVPQSFDPMSGEIYDIADFEEKGGRTHLRIELEDQGSKIIVFRDQPVGRPAFSGEVKETIDITGPWTINFQAGRGAPEKIQLTKLASWSEHSDFGVQHFSGVGTCRTTFSLSESQISNSRFQVDLGEVFDLAEVIVNGVSVDTLWRPPFKVDVTDQIKAGKNSLEIKVVNTWVNRLIGDTKVPEKERICKIVPAEQPWYNEQSNLHPSGLLGPVKLQVYKK